MREPVNQSALGGWFNCSIQIKIPELPLPLPNLTSQVVISQSYKCPESKPALILSKIADATELQGHVSAYRFNNLKSSGFLNASNLILVLLCVGRPAFLTLP